MSHDSSQRLSLWESVFSSVISVSFMLASSKSIIKLIKHYSFDKGLSHLFRWDQHGKSLFRAFCHDSYLSRRLSNLDNRDDIILSWFKALFYMVYWENNERFYFRDLLRMLSVSFCFLLTLQLFLWCDSSGGWKVAQGEPWERKHHPSSIHHAQELCLDTPTNDVQVYSNSILNSDLPT